MMMNHAQDARRAPLWRRVFACFYDAIVLSALCMMVTMIYHSIINVMVLKLKMVPTGYNPLLSLILLLVIFFYFSCAWHRSGQTLGMLAWRLYVRRVEGKGLLSWSQCFLRFIMAIPSIGCLGIGMLWIPFTHHKQAWHDTHSRSEMIVLSKNIKIYAHSKIAHVLPLFFSIRE